MGHGGRAESGVGLVLLAVRTENESSIGKLQCQLLTYFAMVRALRMQNEKKNAPVQGFYSDGEFYRFMAIDPGGHVRYLKLYDTEFELQTIFNWILTMLETAARSSPTTTPAKPGLERDSEINRYRENHFLRLYRPEEERENDDEGPQFVEKTLDDTMEVDGISDMPHRQRSHTAYYFQCTNGCYIKHRNKQVDRCSLTGRL
jgi:hypothetical protein